MSFRKYKVMCVAYLRIYEHQALRVDLEESSESVHRPEPGQSQPQIPPPTVYPFMQEFIQMMRNVGQPPVGSVVDETYKKIKKQGAKAFAGTTDPVVAKE